ncbi:hypothetical protein MtrunA17_Chr4g0069151 [Medicago truncatula]|uniref:Uncharacterized protein n=1 Tax=Medicago truncatula TaxID=3880 RepID=A0A396IHU5_MEDTR|nr:hypothetical protein MtrunA17_Chr4g0069151 [Medicago truncatula]
MLDEQFKDIVLVHYGEGRKSGIFSHLHVVPVTLGGSSSHSGSVPSSSKTSSPISDVQVSLTSNANEIDKHRASEYENVELQNPSQVYSHAQSTNSSIHHCAPQLAHEATGFSQLMRNPIISSWRSDNYQNVNQLDGFGQWMNKETDGDWDNSLMASNSGNNSNTFDVDNLDMDYLEQLLGIDDDFTLDWTFD